MHSILKTQSLHTKRQEVVPKGHMPVYVGEEADKKGYFVPLSYLSHPIFHDLLLHIEQEFGFHHPMGGLMITYTKEAFFSLTSALHRR